MKIQRITPIVAILVSVHLTLRPSSGAEAKSQASHQPDKEVKDSAKRPTPISLKKHVNNSLDGDVHESKAEKGKNHLQNLPKGRQELGGVPFDVDGIVQLHGRPLLFQGKDYPKAVTGIPVGRKAGEIHLLHGTGWRDPHGVPVAKLVLHYEDGSTQEFKLIYGEHVLDWWEIRPEKPRDPQTVIAWHGENPVAKDAKVKLRIMRTTLTNPRPDAVIKAVDYLATGLQTAPFLLGLTVH